MQFKDIIGQRVLINQLTEIIDSGRISHAQLFLGQNGYGSLALAIAYAQYLNCQNRHHYEEGSELRADSCGQCPSCLQYQQLAHPDLHLYFPNATNTRVKEKPTSTQFITEFRDYMAQCGQYAEVAEWMDFIKSENKQGIINVNDAREALTALSYKPYMAPYKVAVFWMAEKMNPESANALLKIIEEPMSRTLILLVAEKSDKMLSTIISRTQLVQVGKIDNASLLSALQKRNPEQNDMQRLQFAAASGEGDIIEAQNALVHNEEHELFTEIFVTWMRQLFKLNMATLSDITSRIHEMGREQEKRFLLFCMDALRACCLKTAAGIELSHKLQFGDEKFNASFAAYITPNNITQLTDEFNNTLYAIERNAYGKLAFMNLSFSISKLLKKR
ncbi:MAG: DNA polymerase III subunit delta [Bacteroidales bacterium]|nr:DNA polymerase III subunit delta [Bacteroidales bacterium]